jgi:hypothetical protein
VVASREVEGPAGHVAAVHVQGTTSVPGGRPEVTVSDLRSAVLIGMRPGHVMHRYLHRLLTGEAPMFPYSADGPRWAS